MKDKNIQNIIKSWPIYLFFVVLMVWSILYYRKNPPKNPNQSLSNSITKNLDPSGIKKVVNSRKGWDPVFGEWWGRDIEEFNFTDINGRETGIGELKGKNVILVFWATWCPPCNQEIPHLKQLRQNYTSDDLEIIAISNESRETLASFSKQKNINYRIASQPSTLPKPMSLISSIPTSFYIDKEGKIRLAALGVVEYQESVNIITAINSFPVLAMSEDY